MELGADTQSVQVSTLARHLWPPSALPPLPGKGNPAQLPLARPPGPSAHCVASVGLQTGRGISYGLSRRKIADLAYVSKKKRLLTFEVVFCSAGYRATICSSSSGPQHIPKRIKVHRQLHPQIYCVQFTAQLRTGPGALRRCLGKDSKAYTRQGPSISRQNKVTRLQESNISQTRQISNAYLLVYVGSSEKT